MPRRTRAETLPVLVFLAWCSTGGAFAAQEIVASRWMEPEGRPKARHAVPARPPRFDILRAEPLLEPAKLPPPPAPTDRVCLVVQDGIYDSISSNLGRYVQDLQAAGYTVVTYRLLSGSAEDLRGYLMGLYEEPDSLLGAQLIGDIPYIIYEMMQDWDGAGGSPPEYEDFPCDLFYMDLNGVWSDVLEDGDVHAGNGKYDTWEGDRDLEIWVSRLKTGNLTALGGEVGVLNNYFDKNHNYRQRALCPVASALVYDDDDWDTEGAEDASQVENVYGAGAVTLVDAPESTTAADYKTNRLTVDQELIFTRSHGYPGGHGYYRNGKSVFEYVFTSDYRSIDPAALFYSLYVCSGGDYTVNNYLAGIAVFNEESGLLAWGATKTGGMFVEGGFYGSLGAGNCFGKAFLDWFNGVNHYPYAPRYWYGMVLIGDASLCPSVTTFVLTVSLPVAATEGDGVLSGAGTLSIPWALGSNLTVSLASNDTSELAVSPSITVPAGQTAVTFDLTVMDDPEPDGTQSVTVTASSPGWISGQASMDVLDNDVALLGISITPDPSTYDFGIIDPGATRTNADQPFVIRNTGNVPEDFGLRIEAEDDRGEWTAGTPGENVYELRSRLAETIGTFSSSDVLDTVVEWCDGIKFGGGGNNMLSGSTVNQWFEFHAPTAMEGVHAASQHTITVEISCRQAE